VPLSPAVMDAITADDEKEEGWAPPPPPPSAPRCPCCGVAGWPLSTQLRTRRIAGLFATSVPPDQRTAVVGDDCRRIIAGDARVATGGGLECRWSAGWSASQSAHSECDMSSPDRLLPLPLMLALALSSASLAAVGDHRLVIVIWLPLLSPPRKLPRPVEPADWGVRGRSDDAACASGDCVTAVAVATASI
jgi:hypothetical protein